MPWSRGSWPTSSALTTLSRPSTISPATGSSPAPLLLIPLLAERTKRIRFSTAVVVLPLRNPIQLAEEIAMLDIMTRGRVEVGFGTGYQQYEFQRFGGESGRKSGHVRGSSRTPHDTTEHRKRQPPGPLLDPTRDYHPTAAHHQAPIPSSGGRPPRCRQWPGPSSVASKSSPEGPPAAWTGSSITGTCSRTPSRRPG